MAKNKKPAASPPAKAAPKTAPKLDAAKLKKLHTAIREVGITYASEGKPIYTRQGNIARWLTDIRAVFLNAQALDVVTNLFWDIYENHAPLQIGGMEVGAIPLVTAILTKATQRGIEANGFIIRKERKDHGRALNIEGTLNTNPVVLVDDVINSGSSLEKCRVVLAAEAPQLKLHSIFVVIDFEGAKGLAWRHEHQLALHTLFRLAEFGLDINAPENPPAVPRFTQAYKPAWRATVKGANPFYVVPKSAPLLVGDNILMGTDSGAFVAFSAQTGEPAWQFECPGVNRKGILSSPAAHKGKVYFGAYNGNLYCLEAATGKQVWMQQLCEWIGSSPLIVPRHNLLYIGLEYARPRTEGSVAAFNLETGARVWESWLKTYQHGSACYYEKADLVIFGTNDNTITAYKAHNGEKVWQVNVRGPVKAPGCVDEERGLAIFGGFDGSIYILDAASGERRAEIITRNVIYTTPLVAGKYLFCGSTDRHLHIVDLTTLEEVKKIDLGARIMARPTLIAPASVVVGTTGGRVFEIDLETLEPSGHTTVPDCITNAVLPLSGGARIVVPTYMNELYCFHRQVHAANRARAPLALPPTQGTSGPSTEPDEAPPILDDPA